MSYGTTISGHPSPVTGSVSTPVSVTINGLNPGTTYHYRLAGTSPGGVVRSADAIFSTSGYNADLSAIALSTGTLSPVFSSGTTSYAASVSSATATITLTPTVASPTSTVKVNGAPVITGSPSLPVFLLPGANAIPIVVTAQDGSTTKTYSVVVTRMSPVPQIAVTQAATSIANGGTHNFGPASGGRVALHAFTIANTGNSNLSGLALSIDGPDASMFSVTTQPTSQPELVQNFFANAQVSGLYTKDQLGALKIGTPLLGRDVTTGLFKLTMGISKSTDLNHFTPFPMTNPQTTINGNGELAFRFNSADRAAFFRVEGK